MACKRSLVNKRVLRSKHKLSSTGGTRSQNENEKWTMVSGNGFPSAFQSEAKTFLVWGGGNVIVRYTFSVKMFVFEVPKQALCYKMPVQLGTEISLIISVTPTRASIFDPRWKLKFVMEALLDQKRSSS